MVLADRMGCLKAGVVENVVVPTPDYVRFATHYGFRPDFCHAADPESKGIVGLTALAQLTTRTAPASPRLLISRATVQRAKVRSLRTCRGGSHTP